MLIGCGADQGRPERWLLGEITDQGALGSAQQPDLLIDCIAGEIAVTPPHLRFDRDDLNRFGLPVAEPGREIGVPVHHGLHCVVQPVVINPTAQRDVDLHRVHIVAAAVRDLRMEQQPLLQGGQRQDIGDLISAAQVVDLLLIQLCGSDIRWRQPTPAAPHIRADTCQRVKPQLAQPFYLPMIESRRRPHPARPQVRAGCGVHRPGVEFHRMHQRHGYRRGNTRDRPAVRADLPVITGCLATAEAPQIVEPDRRIGPGQVYVVIEVAEHPVGQAIRHSPQLFLGILDHRTQPRGACSHLSPLQPARADSQSDRILGREPPHSARQVEIGSQFLLAAVAFDVNGDRRATGAGEFGHRQRERDQQDVLHAGVKRRRHLTEQHPGRLDIEIDRQTPGAGIGIGLRLHRGQWRRQRRDLLPGVHVIDDVGTLRNINQQRRPLAKGRPRRRQHHRLAGAMLGPREVEVLDHDPPRHPVNSQMVHDHHQPTSGCGPQRTQHHACGGVQPRPGVEHRLIGHLIDRAHTRTRIHRPGFGHRQRPAPGTVVVDPKPKRGMPIQQGLENRDHIGLGHADRGLHHRGLVELVNRARYVLQPADDRGGRQRTDTVVDHLIGTGRDTCHPGQPGYGLLDENVARPQRHTGCAGAGHHLHRQDAVPAQLEK